MPAVLPVGPTNSNDSRDVSGAKGSNKECHLESHNLGALKFLEQGLVNCSIELFSHNTAVDILLGPLRDLGSSLGISNDYTTGAGHHVFI